MAATTHTADSDDGSLSRRDSHYNQQRSSLRSDRSLRTPSRPHSSSLLQDFILRDDTDDPSEAPSPSPVIPRRKQSLEKGKRRPSRGSGSRHGSPRSFNTRSRAGSRGGNIDEYLMPSPYDNNIPLSPTENWQDRSFYRHSTVEEERTESRASKPPPRSHRSSFRNSPLSRRGTPGTDFAEITALPTISDAPWRRHNRTSAAGDDIMMERHLVSRLATELYTISYLIFFSILGALARIGLQWLTFYPGAPVSFSQLWTNFAGTLVMGFLQEDRKLFRQEWGKETAAEIGPELTEEEKALEEAAAKASHGRVKKTIPLYIGLATGFCGSFTSFSSFMRDTFFALSNDLPSPVNHPSPPGAPPSPLSTVPRNGGYSFMAVMGVIIITVSLCYAALYIGIHIASYTDRFVPTLPFHFFRRFVDPLCVIIAWGAWIGAVIMAIWPPDRPSGPQSKGSWANETWRGQAIFACVFGPAGTLLRYYVSLKLNTIISTFPLGTFAVNIFGTAVLGMAYDLQHIRISGSNLAGGGRVGCQVLQGIMDGFCGCLTTVSTWIAEINSLKRGSSWIYGTSSVLVGLGALVCIMGSVKWTVGFTATACVT